jgi:dihydrofolate synthase/folylpolyglutamate synthase
LGNPQNELSFAHIAGTNGKGSVLSLVSSVLHAAGYRVGRFFSPSLAEYRERIQFGRRMIGKEDFARCLGKVKMAAEGMAAEGFAAPTAFEVDTAVAFLYFVEKKCQFVVLETGMGGALDATNIVKNTLVAVFTPISIDHSDWLGKTLGEIAEQKAGIIKGGARVVTAKQAEEALEALQAKCCEYDIALQLAPQQQLKNVKSEKPDLKALAFRQSFSYGGLRDLTISMAGRHQIENATLALDVIEALGSQGFPVSEKSLRKGLAEAVWPGRFQMIATKPLVVIDGAHNPAAALRLAETIKSYFTNKRIIYIMGVLADKDFERIILNTCELAEHIITVSAPGQRGMSGYALALEVARHHPQATSADSLTEAYELAALLAGKEGVIVAFGSLSFLGSLSKIVVGIEKKSKRKAR